jgi:hypothetical protein
MNPAKRRPAPHDQPWYLRVLESQGIAVVFALVLLGMMMKVTETHLDFLRKQSAQMELQTHTLEAIAETARRSTESNQRQEGLLREVGENLEDGIGKSVKAHDEILDKLKDVHP